MGDIKSEHPSLSLSLPPLQKMDIMSSYIVPSFMAMSSGQYCSQNINISPLYNHRMGTPESDENNSIFSHNTDNAFNKITLFNPPYSTFGINTNHIPASTSPTSIAFATAAQTQQHDCKLSVKLEPIKNNKTNDTIIKLEQDNA